MAKLTGGDLSALDFDALAEAHERQAVPALIARLGGNDYSQAGMAAKALGEIGDPRAVEPLIQALAVDSRRSGLEAIPPALAKLGDPQAIEPLQAALKTLPPNSSPELRVGILEALVHLDAPDALNQAAAILEQPAGGSPGREVVLALQILGRVGNEEIIPLIEPLLDDQQACAAAGACASHLTAHSLPAAATTGPCVCGTWPGCGRSAAERPSTCGFRMGSGAAMEGGRERNPSLPC